MPGHIDQAETLWRREAYDRRPVESDEGDDSTPSSLPCDSFPIAAATHFWDNSDIYPQYPGIHRQSQESSDILSSGSPCGKSTKFESGTPQCRICSPPPVHNNMRPSSTNLSDINESSGQEWDGEGVGRGFHPSTAHVSRIKREPIHQLADAFSSMHPHSYHVQSPERMMVQKVRDHRQLSPWGCNISPWKFEPAMPHADPHRLPYHGEAHVNVVPVECNPQLLPIGGRGNRCVSPAFSVNPQVQRPTCSHFVRGSPLQTHYHHSTPSRDPRSENIYSQVIIPAERPTLTSMQAAPSFQQRSDLRLLEPPRSLLSNGGDHPYNAYQHHCCQQPAPQLDRVSCGIPQFDQRRDESSDCCRRQPHNQLSWKLRPQTRQHKMIGTEFVPQGNSVALTDQQRKVFVTYSRDNECHTREVNRFVSWLCSNGFYTEIDMLNKLVQSMDNVDYMQRFLNDKNYLIIIAVSPKYRDDVESVNDSDDHSLQTRFIYQQLVSEYISNGSKNFRLIPVLFPGSHKDHIPTWLKNTISYQWPQNQEDILRRVCRIEKYSIPPPGPLPIIVSKSLG